MPGMLEQGMAPQQPPQEPLPQPSSGPPAQTPPPPLPQGDSGGAPGPGHPAQAAPEREPNPEDFETLRDQAIKLVYGERFDQLIQMFQTNGPEKFARSMAIAVNTPITELEKQGPIDPPTKTCLAAPRIKSRWLKG